MTSMAERRWLRWTCIAGWVLPLGLWYPWLLLVDGHPLWHMVPLWCWFIATATYYLEPSWRAGWRTEVSIVGVATLAIPMLAGPFIGLQAAITLACGIGAALAYGCSWARTAEVLAGSSLAFGRRLGHLLFGAALPLSWASMTVGVGLAWLHLGLSGTTLTTLVITVWSIGLLIQLSGLVQATRRRRLAREQLALTT